ncbi:receptor-like serine/threonine-protein kinase At4g25390 [Neltuma alba]|uniref:receptor-like serine/threonine-protein kinase At4g25390 n=1 Tax=Neltuma alba TaxID=207710 RepID=UPI0010A2F7AB|nr:receptor-like serine/threonine-protein kinase At4g25390 [Prosopis alba]
MLSRKLSASPSSPVVSDPYPPPLSQNQPHPSSKYHKSHHLLPPLVASAASVCSFFLLFFLCFRRLARKRTTPSSDSESKPPYRFSYSLLRRATSSFSTRLGQGGFGPVYSGTLPPTRQPIAVKLMDSASLQGEREFHNELFFASRLHSQHVVSAIGFSSDRNRRRFLLVYELMHNGNLQDALLHRKCPELLDWKKRFSVIVDIAKGIQYLHSCDPPVIHGDIKPSNILLDRSLTAKIGDFGLARLKSEPQIENGILNLDGIEKKNGGLELEEEKKGKEEELESNGGSLIEETQSVNTVDEDSLAADQSPEGFVRIPISCDPTVIHGDIKPSSLTAKIGDFGLARLKSEPQIEIGILNLDGIEKKNDGLELEDEKGKEEELESNGGSLIEDTQSVNTVDEGSVAADQSPEGFVRIPISEPSPPPMEVATGASPSEANFDKVSVQSEINISLSSKKSGKVLKSNSMKDWWWKQDVEEAASPMGEHKKVKDYVMEWLGREISKERPKSEWVAAEVAAAATSSSGATMEKTEKKKSKRRLEWWRSMDKEAINPKALKKEKRRPAREWWKEEYCEELAKKKKKKKKKQQQKRNGINSDDDWWVRDAEDLYGERKKAKTRKNSRGNLDSWLDGFSGELFRARRNSHDSAASWEIPKNGGVSSTPSMRGTVCYVAPEYGFGEDLSEKCDIYSFGVLLLVIVSGRRPLQVTGSPLSEFHKANLLSWARHCARNGKLLDLVDPSIKSLDKDQALLCITIALLCLLKTPSRRPSMKEVVGMLNGELEPPQLPVEFSPSTPSRFRSQARRKGP